MPGPDRDRLIERLERLAAGDIAGLDISRLRGSDRMRLRSGDWRAIYRVIAPDTVVVLVAHRREAYRDD